MKIVKIILLILLLIFIIIQFFPKNIPENIPAGDSDLIISGVVPDEIASVFRNSCYDCHSNETDFPWYSRIAPAAWLVVKDIREGREELNFSEWDDYSVRSLIGNLDAIQQEVSSGEMPLPAYTLIHRKAKLDEGQVAAIVGWTEEYSDKILE